jgi:transposase-like protein
MNGSSDKSGEVIKLRGQGLTYRVIGERLGISKVAVYKHLKRKGLTGKVNLISQVRDLQERVGKLEKTISVLFHRFGIGRF